MIRQLKAISLFLGICVGVVTSQINLALEGNVSQSTTYVDSSNYEHSAIRAIEGNETNNWGKWCSSTHGGQRTAWWSLYLPKLAFITDIKIFYRNTEVRERMKRFRLYLTNGSDILDTSAVLCYNDSGPGTPAVTQERVCNKPAQRFFFFNSRENNDTFVELCLVKVHGCWKGTWGTNCSQQCSAKCIHQQCYPGNGSCVWGCHSMNCLQNTCDANTRVCTTGCTLERAGTHCTHHNMAHDGTANQHPSNSNRPASLAIDGNRTSCISFTTEQSAYLQIDTGSFSLIATVYLAVKETIVLANYTLYCSNTTDSWTEGTQLYHGGQLNKDIEIFGFCRYVIYLPPIVNDNSKIDVCELEIGGCPGGRYGVDCENSCPQNCHGPCDVQHGNCLFGCLDGWLDQKCATVCRDGTFGGNCLRNCSANCISDPCNHVTGECVECTNGWKGFNCTTECSKGKFGLDCSESCDGCIESTCDRFNGECVDNSGCKPGYEYGRYCNKTCSKGKFGLNCSESCDGCIGSTCDRLNGECVDSTGCKPGYEYGRYCNETCVDWHFGTKCTKICYCLNNPCDKSSGNCLDGGCKKGWHGQSCDETCSKGTFGFDCSESCDGCIECTCDRFNGECVDSTGCKAGYEYGRYCNETCSTGKYGLDCSESCDGCIESKCDRLTGDCFYSYGCKPGYEYGRYCNRTIPKCDKGKFGLYCTESCDGCIESICNRCDGVCIDSSGCKPGYEYGPYCNKTCMDWHFGTNCTKMCYCLNNPCEKTSGICSDGGCKKGWHGQSCDEECSKGTFGLDCSESCDGCIESACDRFNGECVDSSGCKSGYEHGPYCNKNTQMSLPASSGTAIRGGISAAIMIIIIKIFEVNYVI